MTKQELIEELNEMIADETNITVIQSEYFKYIGEDIKNIAEERGVKLDEATIKEMVEDLED